MLASSRKLRSSVLLGFIIVLLLAVVQGITWEDLGVHVDDVCHTAFMLHRTLS